MVATTRFDIDLVLTRDDDEMARVTANGSAIDVRLARPSDLFGGRRPDAKGLRELAAEVARRGAVVSVSGPDGIIASIGAVRSSRLGALVSRSHHVRLGSWRAVARALRGGSHSGLALPPLPLLQINPTVARGGRSKITTTHYTRGSGRPRVLFALGTADWDGTPPREVVLRPTTTTIGSGPDADLRLEGLAPLHAEIRHTADDEYVLVMLGGGARQIPLLERDPSTGDAGRILHTGARIELGAWCMAFFREEFADHGRPFGGRIGGELSRQRNQPPRHAEAATGD